MNSDSLIMRGYRRALYFAIIGFMGFVASFAFYDGEVQAASKFPVAAKWQRVGSNAGQGQTIVFDANGRLRGFGGCNNFFAEYKTRGRHIKVGRIGSTRMACLNERPKNSEIKYFKRLEKVRFWHKRGRNVLVLKNRRGKTVLRFRRIR